MSNLVLTASLGGTRDDLVATHGLRSAKVVFSRQEADELGLEVDHDDSHAIAHGPSFALLLHGTQAADTEAARALVELRRAGFHGYGANRVPLRVWGGS